MINCYVTIFDYIYYYSNIGHFHKKNLDKKLGCYTIKKEFSHYNYDSMKQPKKTKLVVITKNYKNC